jgi:alcohol dehydrogenase (NADP+)
LAIQFAKGLGAKVIVFSHSPNKKEDSMKLGADEFVSSGEEGFAKPYSGKLDYILSAADVESIPLGDFLGMLKIDGKLTSVGLPDGKWNNLQPQMMASNASCIAGSHIGSKVEW